MDARSTWGGSFRTIQAAAKARVGASGGIPRILLGLDVGIGVDWSTAEVEMKLKLTQHNSSIAGLLDAHHVM